jgi:hypothetical protein
LSTSKDRSPEELIDLVVTEAEIESGLDPSVVSSRTKLGRRGALVFSRKASELEGEEMSHQQAVWSPAEKRFVRKNLGKLSLEEIGDTLGRSENSVKILFTREGWPAPSKQPDELSAHQIAGLLGKCGKSITRLIDDGILPGRRLPMERVIRVVAMTTFKRWLVNPEHWIYFDRKKIRDLHLRRLCELRADRWGDAWVTTGEAARVAGCTHADVNRWIHMGKVRSARKWGANWKLLRSEAEQLEIPKRGKGARGCAKVAWSLEADAFLVLARAVGISNALTAYLMGPGWDKRVGYRLYVLNRDGHIPSIINRHRYPIEFRPGGRMPKLFADWRRFGQRFPFLRTSVDRYLDGERLSQRDLENVRGLLYRWASWHLAGEPSSEKLVRRLQSLGRISYAEKRLRRPTNCFKRRASIPSSEVTF